MCAIAASCTFVRSCYRMISLLMARGNTSDLDLATVDGARRCSIEGMVRSPVYIVNVRMFAQVLVHRSPWGKNLIDSRHRLM